MSDRASADRPRRVLQLLLLVLRPKTMGTDLPHALPMLYIEKGGFVIFKVGVHGGMIEMLIDLVTRLAQCEPKE